MPKQSLHIRSLPELTDFDTWYSNLVEAAEMAEFGPVDGTMTVRPYGFAVWDRIKSELSARITASGVPDAYFPLLIPSSYMRKVPGLEKRASELAIVTRAGGEELADPAIIRFTSETLINEAFSRWITSVHDLPFKVNQWANVVRWETHTSLFMRTNEFLWQEGHTAHRTRAEAHEFARTIQRDVYESVLERVLAIPVLAGIKSPQQRSGTSGHNTFTCEAITGDGRALQMATSVEGEQTYAKAFGVRYTTPEGTVETPWMTAWGTSTRLIGGLIMAHGDVDGLRLPPALAPVQAVIIPTNIDEVSSARRIEDDLRSQLIRCHVDVRFDLSFEQRSRNWQTKGVPLRLEVGAEDANFSQVAIVHRLFGGWREIVAKEELTRLIGEALIDEQNSMLDSARAERDSRIKPATTVEETIGIASEGWARVPWAVLAESGEEQLARFGLSVRCLQRLDGSVPEDGAESDLVAFVARSH